MTKDSRDTTRGSSAERISTASLLLRIILIIAAGILAYCNTFSVPFVFDDISSIVENRVIKDLGSFISGAGYAYNPRRFVGYLTFALNYRFGGLDVFGYHLVNLVIHIANGLLVYALASLALRAANGGDREPGTGNQERPLLVPGPGALVPLFAAILFVVHPVQTQAVTYVVQRLASLATFFYLGSMVCYAYGRHWAKDEGKTSLSPFTFHRSPLTWFFLALISGLLALKTKEITVTLPLAIILYEFIFLGYSRKKLLILLAPLAMGALVAAADIAGSDRPLGELLSDVTEMSRETTVISRSDYLVTQFSVIATYLRLLILPVGQNLDYDYPVYGSLLQAKPLLGLLLHISLTGGAIWAWVRSGTSDQESGASEPDRSPFTAHLSLLAFGILWFYLTLMVESSLIPIKDVIYEHRLYLPSFGFFLAAAAIASLAVQRMSLRGVMAGGLLVTLILVASTWDRNRVWRDEITLWSDVVAKSPAKGRPRVNLGNYLEQAGRGEEALASYREGVRLQPRVADSHNNLGAALFRRGDLQAALAEYSQAIALRPGYVRALNNMGIALVVAGRPAEALEYYKASMEVDRDNGETWYNLGVALMEGGDRNGALEALGRAITLSPGSANAHNTLGNLYGMQGLTEQAIWHHRRAIELDPGLDKAYLGLASDCEALGLMEEAEQNYRQAIRLNPAFSEARTNLGILLVETGRAAEGIAQLEAVLSMNPGNADARTNLVMARKRAAGKP